MESGSLSLKQEYEKLPRIGLNNKDSDSSNCMVPILEAKSDKLKDENLRRFNNCVPDELILSIKQAEIPREFLGPPSKKTLQNVKPTVPSILKRPDNAWNYEKQREKFKFLTDQPICSCGAGKDISFIYDCVIHNSNLKTQHNPSKYDLSAVRLNEPNLDKSIKIDDTLVPDEFHVVKSQGVWPLKFEEEKYSTLTEDHYNHLTVFPSLKPSGRNEVKQLKHTMEALLKRVGADIVDQKGPTQLHNLLEIIKQEQDIYNIVFHEVIRQVTVECKDRGEVLAKLRERYANLLSRVPREIKSLHEEIVAQRALDRRLTEELMQFKTTIEYLTDELTHVKQHDKLISNQATIYQKDLHNALLEAQKNAALLNEYHELYELQRKRLEKSIESLIEERDIWTKTAYNIALKVTDENKLITAQRLNVAEKAWAKLARHFAILISDKDTKELNEIQKYSDEWKETIEELKLNVIFKETQTRNILEQMRLEVDRLKFILQPSTISNISNNSTSTINNSTSGKSSINSPDLNKMTSLLNQLKKIYEITVRDAENYSGDAVLNMDENLKKADRCLFHTVQLSNKIISRHEPAKEQAKVDKYTRYESLQTEIKQLHEQYRNRASGDNGLSKYYSILNGGLDLWIQKFTSQILSEKSGKRGKQSDTDWLSFTQAIDDWQEALQLALKSLGFPLRHVTDLQPSALHENENQPVIVVHEDIFIEMHKWLTALFQHIDTQDACLIDEVSKNHKDMIYWMIQVLVRLAPDRENLSNEVKKLIYNPETSIENLVQKAEKLMETIDKFTQFIINKASELLPNVMKKETNTPSENSDLPTEAEKESKKLQTLRQDCQEWIYTVKLLITELTSNDGYQRKKSIFSKFIETDTSEKEDSFHEDLEVKAIEANANESKNETKESDYPNVSTTGKSTGDIKTDENEETDNEAAKSSEQNVQTDKNENTPSFEILTSDANTQRKFLDNIDLNEANQLTQAELKSTVFNAMNTIDKLQSQLIHTEERAQYAEGQVSELEMKLKEALERIRLLEKQTLTTSKNENA